jgi:hypothetical protein
LKSESPGDRKNGSEKDGKTPLKDRTVVEKAQKLHRKTKDGARRKAKAAGHNRSRNKPDRFANNPFYEAFKEIDLKRGSSRE